MLIIIVGSAWVISRIVSPTTDIFLWDTVNMRYFKYTQGFFVIGYNVPGV